MGDFHFLRPWWLVALVPLAIIVWALRRASDAATPWRGIVADHLLPYLVQGTAVKRRLGPWWMVVGSALLAVIILAGPAWKREPSPFADDVAALAIVIRISPSMQTEDIAPNRLARSVQKVHDLLGRRGGSKAALIAYAGSAHLVMPPTVDVEIIDSFAGSLDPKIMPEEGDAAGEALKLADQTLATVGGGSILWITDEVSPDEVAAVSLWRSKTHTPIRVLAPVSDEAALKDLRSHTESGSSELIQLTPDDSDIDRLERASRFSAAAPMEGGDRWQDSGYWLTPVLVLLVLAFFRKGWMQSLAARS
ncbi:VWA domain-containing protein [Luteolibacter soli]|uniref:VWA domain-containing protein n=1 Tax=Luteolibacter soli TaxID=3135280 RepID=A0ABU9ANV6_9BACT